MLTDGIRPRSIVEACVNAQSFVKLVLVTLPVFLVIDLLWLGVVARGFYQRHLGHLFRANVQWSAAIAFYVIFVAAIVVFAVMPALQRESVGHAIRLGAFFGLATYAAYDLTNLATLDGFPAIVAVVDLAWGAVLTASVAAASYQLAGFVTG